jgi:alkylation response protein AidB-like acyl-CoA dehydrogenase
MARTGELAPFPGTDLLDDRMRALYRYCGELASEFREPGLAIDADPDRIDDYLHLPGVRLNQFVHLPPRYRPQLDFPPAILDAGATSLGWVVLWEQLAYGDPGVTLAGPRPSLFGAMVTAMADESQSERYFSRLAATPANTFFGLTEPARGSAAIELETAITPVPGDGGWLLNGEKCYIGNGARSVLGVVFCRRAPGPFGIEAVVLDTSSPGFSAELLPTIGLRGARISRMRFENVPVPPENLLGAHLPPGRRGLNGALPALYRARPSVAAMAIGCARAVCDYVGQQRSSLAKADQWRMDELLDRMAAIRRLIYRTAADIDLGIVNVHRIGAVKVQAAHLAEEATLLAADLLGAASLIEHTWLEKIYRDVRAFEFAEGTTNVHWLSIFAGLRKRSFL